MADDHTPEQRSYNMSRIQRKNTAPEYLVRRFLFSKGLRYRIDDKRFPGRPDIVFPKYKTVVFVNGCFWHHHDCKYFVWPKSNMEYWTTKIKRNEERDAVNIEKIQQMGWKVIIVWECELKKEVRETTLSNLYSQITLGQSKID